MSNHAYWRFIVSKHRDTDNPAKIGQQREEWRLFWSTGVSEQKMPGRIKATKPHGLKQGEVLNLLRTQERWDRQFLAAEITKALGLPPQCEEGVRFHLRNLRSQGYIYPAKEDDGKISAKVYAVRK